MSFSLDIIFYTPIVFIVLYLLCNKLIKTPKNVAIIVLGDIGRSPRMQYHALSFAKENFRVYLIGYPGSKPHEHVLQNENIKIYNIKEPPICIKHFPKIFAYLLKAFFQSITLIWTLLLIPNISSILIQNPPSIPTMIVSYVVSKVRFASFIIDWHNYGHTILSMSLKKNHPLVKFSEMYEKFCGRLSAENICVTKAMKKDLQTNWNVMATTVYDRAPDIFQSVEVSQQHKLFTRLAKDYPVFGSKETDGLSTRFTQVNDSGAIVKSEHRPALLISSTSWTEDEDFSLLLNALTDYDKNDEEKLPDLVCVITGKGPQKEFYKQKIASMTWKKVDFCLPWLEAGDYPLMLGSADVGVCLHTSSSGLDLPMKVVDMYGCGLPVCAVNFNCIDELVKDGENGLIFNNEIELSSQLKELLWDFPNHSPQLAKFRENLKTFQATRWHDQWKTKVLPIFVESTGNPFKENRPNLLNDNEFTENDAAADSTQS